jgi:RNA polymerase sigma factor (sigma-70 family)
MSDTNDRRAAISSLEEIVRVLSSCRTGAPSPRVAEIYAAFSRQWKAAARRRLPWLGDADVEDAVQDTWEKLVSPARLGRLHEMFAAGRFADLHALESWAFVMFLHTSVDRGRALRRSEQTLDDPDGCAGVASPAMDAESLAARRQILERAGRAIRSSRIAEAGHLFQAHFVDGDSDQEIADALGVTRDSVAGRLKRMRRLFRDILGEREAP